MNPTYTTISGTQSGIKKNLGLIADELTSTLKTNTNYGQVPLSHRNKQRRTRYRHSLTITALPKGKQPYCT